MCGLCRHGLPPISPDRALNASFYQPVIALTVSIPGGSVPCSPDLTASALSGPVLTVSALSGPVLTVSALSGPVLTIFALRGSALSAAHPVSQKAVILSNERAVSLYSPPNRMVKSKTFFPV